MFLFPVLFACSKPTSIDPPPIRSTVFPRITPTKGTLPDWAESCCAVPQLDEKWLAYAEKEDSNKTVGVLMCRVSVGPQKMNGRHWDVFGNPPDPKIELTVRSVSHGSVFKNDTFNAFVTWPGVALQPGWGIEVRVTDMDLRHHDHIGQQKARFEGAYPFFLKDDVVSTDCHALSEKRGEQLAVSFIREALDKIDRDTVILPNAYSAGWGLSNEEIVKTHAMIIESASFLGWKHQWIGGLLSYHSENMKVINNRIREDMDRQRSQTSFSAKDGSLTIRWIKQECTLEECIVEFEFQVDQAEAFDFLYRVPFAAVAVFPDGRDRDLKFQKAMLGQSTYDSTATLQPEETMRVWYRTSNLNQHGEIAFVRGSGLSGKIHLLTPKP